MGNSQYILNWADLAFGSKKPLRSLNATFIVAPREMSVKRFTQLVKKYLPKGNIVLGLANEQYIDGFEDQPQFRTLQLPAVQAVINKVNLRESGQKIVVLQYFQRELPYILEKVPFDHVVLVNGSWKHTFHTTPAYYQLARQKISYEHISPFTDDEEAKAFVQRHEVVNPDVITSNDLSVDDMLRMAQETGKKSYDYSLQVGAVLGKGSGGNYKFLLHAHNKIVPYETYAMHNGAAREIHFSPPHDQSHYDTVHAETELILAAQKAKLDISGSTLFISLLPCPSCARMLCDTDIREIIYSNDHSNGYAIKMLEAAGKTVTRIVR